MKERFAKLIDVKSIITLTFTAVIAYMSVNKIEIPEEIKNIYVVIIGFYFGTQFEKKNGGSK